VTDITLVRNDANYVLQFYIKDQDGNAVNLTDVSSLTLKIQKYGTSTLHASISGSVVNATEGICQFTVQDEFTAVTGDFKAEVEITYSSGKTITAPEIYIKVIPDLPS